MQVVWPFAMAGFWETLNLGQIYAFLGLLTTGAWLLLDRRPVLAGVLLGAVVAVKPNFAVWPVLLFLIAQRKAALSALFSAALFACLPAVVYGVGIYSQWLSAVKLEGPNPQVGNAAVSGLLIRLGAPALAVPAAALGLAALAWWVWRRHPGLKTTNGLALTGLLLFSPLAWVGYSVFLMPIFVARHWDARLSLAAILLWVPRLPLQQWTDTSFVLQLTVGSAYSVALGLVVWSVLGRCRASTSDANSTRIQPSACTTEAINTGMCERGRASESCFVFRAALNTDSNSADG